MRSDSPLPGPPPEEITDVQLRKRRGGWRRSAHGNGGQAPRPAGPYGAAGFRDLEEAGWRLKHLGRAFRDVRASRITGPAITAYIGQRQREEIVTGERATARWHRRAAGTINRKVSLLLRMLRLGLEHQFTRLPIVHKPKEAAPCAGFFGADDFKAVRAPAGGPAGRGDDRLLVRLADAERGAGPRDAPA